MAEIWRTHDRLGRDVVFTSAGRDHILRKHCDMASRLNAVRITIEQAAVITRDFKYRRRENHYWQTAPGKTWISDPLDAPGFPHVAIMLGVGPDDEETDEIVGVQVIPMMLGTIQEQPEWALLVWAAMASKYGTELLKERLPIFLDEVREAFEKYWQPVPPIEEQLAALERRRDEQRSGQRMPRSA